MSENSKITVVVFLIIVGFVGFCFLMKALTIIPAGHVGVRVLFGKVQDQEMTEGLYLRNPFLSIKKMTIRIQEYTMSIATEEGKKKGDDSIEALTKEGLKILVDTTVWYRLQPDAASDVYRDIGKDYIEIIVRPAIRTAIRDIVATYEAKEIYAEKRDEATLKIAEKLENIKDKGIVIDRVLIRNIKLPSQLTQAIESKLGAEQEAQKMIFVLEKEELEAERKGIEAKGIKIAQETIERTLTPEYLRWYSIEMMRELAESPNSTFLFVPVDQNGMPIINIYPGQ